MPVPADVDAAAAAEAAAAAAEAAAAAAEKRLKHLTSRALRMWRNRVSVYAF